MLTLIDRLFRVLVFSALLSWPGVSRADEASQDLFHKTMQAWEQGEMSCAESLAQRAASAPDRPAWAFRILGFSTFMRGHPDQTIELLNRIPEGEISTPAERFDTEVARFASLLRLKQYASAKACAPATSARCLADLLRAYPTEYPTLDGPVSLRFESDEDSLVAPRIGGHVNGNPVRIGIDTGCGFMTMNVANAVRLGVPLRKEADLGNVGGVVRPIRSGVAEKVMVGSMLVRRLPVSADPGSDECIFVGVNFLEEFLVTLDPRGSRILFSKNGPDAFQRYHRDLHFDRLARIRFYRWGDHEIFLGAKLGDRHVNLCVDTGYEAPHGPAGQLVDVALTSAGASRLGLSGPPSRVPLQLEGLVPRKVLVGVQSLFDSKYCGGIRIDGYLTYRFLGRFVWTMDFGDQTFILSSR